MGVSRIDLLRCGLLPLLPKRADGLIPRPGGGLAPCACPDITADALESVVWQTVTSLIRDPEFLVSEIRQRNEGPSQTGQVLEKRLSHLTMGQNQEEQVRAMVSRMGKGLGTMDFVQKQELLRLLVEKVYYRGTEPEISTIIPLEPKRYQSYPTPQEGARSDDTVLIGLSEGVRSERGIGLRRAESPSDRKAKHYSEGRG